MGKMAVQQAHIWAIHGTTHLKVHKSLTLLRLEFLSRMFVSGWAGKSHLCGIWRTITASQILRAVRVAVLELGRVRFTARKLGQGLKLASYLSQNLGTRGVLAFEKKRQALKPAALPS